MSAWRNSKISTPLPKATDRKGEMLFCFSVFVRKIISIHRLALILSLPVPVAGLVAKVVDRCLVAARSVAASVGRQDVFWKLGKLGMVLHCEPVVWLPGIGRAARLQCVVDGLAADVARRVRCLVSLEALLAQPAPFLRIASNSWHVIPFEVVGAVESMGKSRAHDMQKADGFSAGFRCLCTISEA